MAVRRTATRRVQRRKLVWARSVASATVSSPVPPALNAPTRFDILSSFETIYGAQLLGATIMRVRGRMGVAGVSTEGVAIRATMRIGSQNEVVRGPNANDNAFDSNAVSLDYFMFEPFLCNTAAGATLTNGNDIHGRMIDVRSHRKLEELNQSLILDYSSVGLGVAVQNITMVHDLSILVALA